MLDFSSVEGGSKTLNERKEEPDCRLQAVVQSAIYGGVRFFNVSGVASLRRRPQVFSKPEYERLSRISVSHI